MMNNRILQGHKETADNWYEELTALISEDDVIYEGPAAGECAEWLERQRLLDKAKLESK